VNSGKAQLAAQFVAFGKLLISLAGETNDNIGGDGYLGYLSPN